MNCLNEKLVFLFKEAVNKKVARLLSGGGTVITVRIFFDTESQTLGPLLV